MENMKKMLLVEPDFIERLKHSDNVSENSSSRLDGEMQKILKTKMNDREKWALYSQALQRFLHFTRSDRQPFKIPLVDDVGQLTNEKNDFNPEIYKKEENVNNNSVENVALPELEGDIYATPPGGSKSDLPKQYSPSYIVDVIPKSYKTKSKTLLECMVQSKPKIWWKENGEVVINNRTIPNSNILELVGDVLRPLKRSKPIGWEDFASILHDIRVPTACIGNPTNLKFMKGLQSTDPNTSIESTNTYTSSVKEKNTSTPLSTKAPNQSKKKLDWERWTPY
jgi:hypothetical protein